MLPILLLTTARRINYAMKLTLQLKLLPTTDQKAILLATMKQFNAAATYAARIGFEAKVYGQVGLHKLTYYNIRKQFGLSSHLTVRAIAKAVECFKRDKTKCHVFKSRSATIYNYNMLSFKSLTTLSVLTLSGRTLIPFICGDYWKPKQGRIKGEMDLIYRDRNFYLLCVIDEPEETPITPVDILGVDLGIVNIATDSTGEIFTGCKVEQIRQQYSKRRAGLNRTGTKSARRRLSKARKRESNFRKNENHRISKCLVAKAKATNSAIALEDLKGIQNRVTVKKQQRARHNSWSFAQLRTFIEYKALLSGVPLILIDPRNTSRTCSSCGHCEKSNRKSQSEFVCCKCNYSMNADCNAALNIRTKALVKVPIVGIDEAKAELSLSCG